MINEQISFCLAYVLDILNLIESFFLWVFYSSCANDYTESNETNKTMQVITYNTEISRKTLIIQLPRWLSQSSDAGES